MQKLLLLPLTLILIAGCMEGGQKVDDIEPYTPKNVFFGVIEINSTANAPHIEEHFVTYGDNYPPSVRYNPDTRELTFGTSQYLWGIEDGSGVLLVIDQRKSPVIEHTESTVGIDLPGFAVRAEINGLTFHMNTEGAHLGSFYFGPHDFTSPFDVFTHETMIELEGVGFDYRNAFSTNYHRVRTETGYNSTSNQIEDVNIAYNTTIYFTYYGKVTFIPADFLQSVASSPEEIMEKKEMEERRRALRAR